MPNAIELKVSVTRSTWQDTCASKLSTKIELKHVQHNNNIIIIILLLSRKFKVVFFWKLFEKQMVQTLILVHEYYLGLCWFGQETYSTSSVWNTELKYFRLENECSNNTFHIRPSPLQKEGPATSCSFHFWTSPWN